MPQKRRKKTKAVYVPKNYPDRECIVCGDTFKPKKIDHVFCSFEGNDSCWAQARNAERDLEWAYHKALVDQEYCCWKCKLHAEDAKLRAMILNPDGLASENDLKVVATCTPCRKNHYIELATVAT